MTLEQERLMEIFNRILDFLEEKGIRYYLLGGTAIGAIRHNGFIPWDDDIDIMLDIDNYHRLIDLADQLPWDDIEFISSETDPEYYRPFARFAYKKDTMFMKSGMFNHGKCMGTLIDVMPLYDVPSSMIEDYIHDYLLYQEVLALPNTYKKDIYWFREEYYALKDAEKTEGRTNIIKRLRDKVESYAQYDCDRKVVGLWGAKLRDYDAKWFEGEPRYYPFEGRLMPVPHYVEACLRYQYGLDWYMIPKTQEQKTHKFYRDWEISASNYYDDMSLFVDWDEADEKLNVKKRAQVEMLGAMAEVDRYKSDLFARRVLMNADIKRGDITGLVSKGDYNSATERIEQITGNIKSFKAIAREDIDLTETDAEAAVKALIYTGRCSDAAKFADVLKIDENSDAADLLCRTKQLCVNWQDRIADGTLQKVKAALDTFSREELLSIPDCLAALAYMTTSEETAELFVTTEDVKDACVKYLETIIDNSEVKKALADILWNEGQTAKAKELYKAVSEESRNGLIILDAKSKI